MTPAPTQAAAKRSVRVTAQAAKNPPWLQPPMPEPGFVGDAVCPTSRSIPVRTSVNSAPPTSPATLRAKACPWPRPPRALGRKTANPAAASH